jgi:hypothetical protein
MAARRPKRQRDRLARPALLSLDRVGEAARGPPRLLHNGRSDRASHGSVSSGDTKRAGTGRRVAAMRPVDGKRSAKLNRQRNQPSSASVGFNSVGKRACTAGSQLIAAKAINAGWMRRALHALGLAIRLAANQRHALVRAL